MTILVSACLLGVPCRYDGQSKAHPLARALCEKHHVVPVCGEIFGGLPTPRPPAEIQGDRVVTRDGQDVTEAYRRGAEAAAQLARLTGAQAAVLLVRQTVFRGGQPDAPAAVPTAPAVTALPAPTHVFLGGTTRDLRNILDVIVNKNPEARIVATAVTLESLGQLTAALSDFRETESG